MRRLLLLAFLLACGRVEAGAASVQAPASGGPPGHKTIAWEDVVIRLERTECFGTCPTYTVEIQGTGLVTYAGEHNVAVLGPITTEIDRKSVLVLINAILKARFFDAPDAYDGEEGAREWDDGRLIIWEGHTSDLPSAIIRVRIGERSNSVTLRDNVPVEFEALATKIDDIAKVSTWVKGSPQK